MVQTTPNVAAPRRAPTRVLGAALCGLYGCLIAFAVQTLFIERFAVNVPYWDEWTQLGLFAAHRAGGLTWHDLFAQHNEHRIVTERLAVLALYHLFGEWNLITNMVFSALLLALSVGMLAYTLYRIGVSPLIIVLLGLILTSPVQWENTLWGFQFQWLAMVFGALLAVCALVLDDVIRWRTIALCIVGCLISSLSMLPGLLSWAVVGATLLVRARLAWPALRAARAVGPTWRRIGVFAVAAVACGLLYLQGYDLPRSSNEFRAPSAARFLTALSRALAYPLFDTFPVRETSTPLAVALAVAQWLCIGAALRLYLRDRWRPAYRDRLVLFVGIGLFLLVNGLATGYARGAMTYVPSRYATIFLLNSVLTLIAAADLLRASRHLPRLAAAGALLVLSGLVVSLLLVHCDRYLHAVGFMQTQRPNRQADRQTIVNYLRDASPDRVFTGVAIFPPGLIKQGLLARPELLAELPSDMLPPLTTLPAAVNGNAWGGDGAFERTVGDAPPEHWGTFRAGGPTATGQMRLGPLSVRKPVLRIPIAGSFSGFGNSLRIEDAADPTRWIEYSGPSPDAAWTTWWADVGDFVGRDVFIVADDATTEPAGWLAVGPPRPMQRTLALFEIALGQIGVALCCVALTGLGVLVVLAHRATLGRGPDLTHSVALATLVLLGGLASVAVWWLAGRAAAPDQVAWNRGVTRVGGGGLDLLDYLPPDAIDDLNVRRSPEALSMHPDATRRLGPFTAGSNICFAATAALSPPVTVKAKIDGVEFRYAIVCDGIFDEGRVALQASASREIAARVPADRPFFVRLTTHHRETLTTDWAMWMRPRLVSCPEPVGAQPSGGAVSGATRQDPSP